jgi:hypothetical protein
MTLLYSLLELDWRWPAGEVRVEVWLLLVLVGVLVVRDLERWDLVHTQSRVTHCQRDRSRGSHGSPASSMFFQQQRPQVTRTSYPPSRALGFRRSCEEKVLSFCFVCAPLEGWCITAGGCLSDTAVCSVKWLLFC